MSHHQGIIPPFMLEAIQANGTPAQQEWATATLAIRDVVHAERAQAPTKAEGLGEGALPATVAIYDTHQSESLPGTLARADNAPAGSDVEVNEAHDGLRATLDFYSQVYSRNSVDNAGLDLIGTVHYGVQYDNAEWTGSQMIFGDGDGTLFNRFTISIDVMGHELTHGVTQYTAGLDYQDQSGALNESVSDVFGSLVKQYHASPRQSVEQADWLIGAGLLAAGVNGVALRSMMNPGTAYDDPRLGQDPQPGTMAGYVTTSSDSGGVHTNSGIPNHAFYLAAKNFGGYAWETAGLIWYKTLTGGHLPAAATFAQFAQLTVDTANALFGSDGAAKVIDAWAQVGITTSEATITTRIGVLTTTGEALVKEGGLSTGWTDEYSDVQQVMVSPNRVAVLTAAGEVLVKEGGLSTGWVIEYTGVAQLAITNTRIAVLTTAGEVLVKEGGLSTGWVTEYTGVGQVVLSDNRIGVLTTGGQALVKEGGLSTGWVDEYEGVSQLAVTDTRIAVLTSSGDALVKEGGLSAGWVDEYHSVRQVVVSANRVGVLTTGGDALVKEGGLSTGWVTEYTGVEQLAITDTRIGVLTTGGDALVKEGGLSTGWVDEYHGVRQLSIV